MRTLLALSLFLFVGLAHSATPNLGIAWTGTAEGAEFMRLKCGTPAVNTDNVTSPQRLTDDQGAYVLGGAAQGASCVLVGVNSQGEGLPSNQLYLGRPSAAPGISIIVLP